MMWVYDHTVDKVFPIEEKVHVNIQSSTGETDVTRRLMELAETKGALKYMIVFIFFRFAEHLAIFWLAYILWSYFVKNDWLIFFGLLFLCMAIGNSGAVADLTFNTYIDNILYLFTACIIVYRLNPWWMLLITTIGAFNRETSILIPFLYFISATDLTAVDWRRFRLSAVKFPALPIWILTAAQYVIFVTIFLAIRHYYGYRPQQTWKVPAGLPMLKLNLLSADGVKSYFEMIGTFSIIPFIILYKFKSFPYRLRTWFIAIVPIWFAVHLLTVVTYQTRLFLVPLIIIFMPMMLWLVENYGSAPLKQTASAESIHEGGKLF
jgi:hypothetical protein